MKIGRLRNYITIQQPTESFDSNGELVLTWSTFVQCWAEILPLVGREYYSARQVNAELTGKIRMRYIKNITAKMRIIDGAKTYEIASPPIDVENKHIELVLLVKET